MLVPNWDTLQHPWTFGFGLRGDQGAVEIQMATPVSRLRGTFSARCKIVGKGVAWSIAGLREQEDPTPYQMVH